MTRGRKPLAVPEIIEPDLDQPRIDNAMVAMRETAISEEMEIRADVYRLGQLVGARQMNQWNMKMAAAADIQLFEEISKAKGYKHIPIARPDGSTAAAANIEEFCRLVFGKSYDVVAESRRTMQALGAECYEIANRMGLPRTQMRLLLSLPEDERAAVEEAMKSESKAEVVSLIESLANKLDETRAEVEELKGELKATEDISSEKTRRIEKLLKDQHRIQAAPPDEISAQLHKEATAIHNDIRGAITGQLRQALIALNNHGENRGEGASTVFMAGLVGQLAIDLVALRDEFGLPDVDRGEHGWVDGED